VLPGPGEVRGRGPVAAEPDLHDVLTSNRTLLDQEPKRRAVRQAWLLVRVVGVRVEVDEAQRLRSNVGGHRSHVRVGDGVVSARTLKVVRSLADGLSAYRTLPPVQSFLKQFKDSTSEIGTRQL